MASTAAADFALIPPPRGPVFHLGPRPNPFRWRAPAPLDLTADRPITVGNRLDAPDGDYKTLYCATEPYGALLEKLSAIKRDPDLARRVEQELDEDPDPQYDRILGSSRFPVEIFDELQLGSFTIDPELRFVDVEDPRTHAALEKYGGSPLLRELGITRIDRGTFLSPDRGLTRRAANELYVLLRSSAAGLRYTSALDAAAECWAIWDHACPRLTGYDIDPIDPVSPDFRRVLPRLGFSDSS